MHDSLVSCIIPVWNGDKYLEEAIQSVLDQTYSRLEIVVVDDGSTDGTTKVISSFGDRLVSIRQKRAGPAAARNSGVNASRGDFIAFLDADDIWEPRKTEIQIARMLSREDLSICLCEVKNFWSPEIVLAGGQSLTESIEPVSGWFAQSMMVRRTVFHSIGLFDPALRHREAMEWLRRATDAGVSVDVVKEVLVHRRLHLTNRSRARAGDDHKALLKIAQDAMIRRRSK